MSAETKLNLKKKIDDNFIAENLDNKASFKSILESVTAKRGKEQALSHYVNCTTRRRRRPSLYFAFTDFLYPSVPRNAFSDNWDGELNSGFFQSLPFRSLMPWMITQVQENVKQDPVTDIIRQKYEWNQKLVNFKKAFSLKQKHKWFGSDLLYCPTAFIEMAEHIEYNPDPFFNGINNWYYAGEGNMLILQLDGSDYIIHCIFNCLYVTPFFKDTMSMDNANTATYKYPEELNILETVQSLHFIALRTKCKVIILRLVTSEVLRLERLKEIDSEIPFTSIKFDSFHKNILYVTTLDYKLTIVNLDRMTARSKKLRGKFSTLVDNWSMVVSGDRTNYAHITKTAITLYDKRTGDPYQRWKNFKAISDIETCSNICTANYCDQKPLMYVATEHQLFLMDMRCGKTKDDNMKAVQRWSHGMISLPTNIVIRGYDNIHHKEMVCLSSQWCEDMCIVNNYSDKLTRTGEILGLSMPYRPPTILQTLNEAHKNNLCYSMYSRLYQRLCTSITGTAIADRGDCYCVLMQNSVGDISCHALHPEHMYTFIEDDNIENLHEWCKDYQLKFPFEVSHVIDIRMFLKKLYQVPDDFLLGRNVTIKHRNQFNEQEIYDTFAQHKLDSEFLQLWKENDAEITLGKTDASMFVDDSQL